jgi:hypothetical protein
MTSKCCDSDTLVVDFSTTFEHYFDIIPEEVIKIQEG